MKIEFGKLAGEAERAEEYARTHPEPSEPPKIVYCMSFYEERMQQVISCVQRVRPHVDRCILVYDDSVSEKSRKLLSEWDCELVYSKWDNNLVKQRNAYLDHVKEGEWVLVSDPDELMSEPLVKDLKDIVFEAEKQGFNMLGINSHDILIMLDGKREESLTVSAVSAASIGLPFNSRGMDFSKNMLFKFEEGVRYVGVVRGTLLPGVHGWRVAHLDRRYYFEHTKKQSEIWERATRNFHIAGGGKDLEERNPMWVEYRDLIKRLGLPEDCPQMREYLRKGNVHADLKSFLVSQRNRNVIPDADTELRGYFKWYFKFLHPEENTL